MAATRRKSGASKASRRHARRRSATSGKILPPLDVRSSAKVSDLVKRIRQGPLTLVLVYADWCGHCHELMPHWDRAANSSGRQIQAVKVNETMLSEVNDAIHKNVNQSAPSIEVEGYPTIRMLNNQGEILTDIEPTKDTKTLSRVMNESAELAKEAGLANAPATVAPINRNAPAETVTEQIASLSSLPASSNSAATTLGSNEYVSMKSIPSASGSSPNTALSSIDMGDEEALLIQPTSMSEDLESVEAQPKPLTNLNARGGSLYSALARTAYTLAPAASLLAISSAVMSGKKRSHGGKHTRRGNKRRGNKRRGNKKHTRRHRRR